MSFECLALVASNKLNASSKPPPPSDLTPCWVSLADGEEGEEGVGGWMPYMCVYVRVCFVRY